MSLPLQSILSLLVPNENAMSPLTISEVKTADQNRGQILSAEDESGVQSWSYITRCSEPPSFPSFLPKLKTYPNHQPLFSYLPKLSGRCSHISKASHNAGYDIKLFILTKHEFITLSPLQELQESYDRLPHESFGCNYPACGRDVNGENKPHGVSLLLVRKKGTCSTSKGVTGTGPF